MLRVAFNFKFGKMRKSSPFGIRIRRHPKTDLEMKKARCQQPQLEVRVAKYLIKLWRSSTFSPWIFGEHFSFRASNFGPKKHLTVGPLEPPFQDQDIISMTKFGWRLKGFGRQIFREPLMIDFYRREREKSRLWISGSERVERRRRKFQLNCNRVQSSLPNLKPKIWAVLKA